MSIPKGHPLRPMREMVDQALAGLSPMPYSVRSERILMEQLDYNLRLRWFVGLAMDEEVWDPTVFTKNRDRLLAAWASPKSFRPRTGTRGTPR